MVLADWFHTVTGEPLTFGLDAVMFFITSKQTNVIKELANMNWAPYVLGFVIVGLEVGFIYMYKVGWQVSTASIVQSSFLAIILIFVGLLLYHEALTWNKIVGVFICLVGLVFINLK
jgi:drug/metabolite transporter (DMT)-like permease